MNTNSVNGSSSESTIYKNAIQPIQSMNQQTVQPPILSNVNESDESGELRISISSEEGITNSGKEVNVNQQISSFIPRY